MRIKRLADELVEELRVFDPPVWSGAQCAELVEVLARAETAIAVVRARAAMRAAECGEHRQRGFREPADWVARTTGSTPSAARTELETMKERASCPATEAAVAAGLVSLAQAAEIVSTASAVPGSEADLLELAKTGTLSRVRDAARKQRLAAVPVEELYERQRAAREVKHWRDELGMLCGTFRLPPDVGVPLVNRLDRATDRLRRDAKRCGNAERWEQHAADALVAMADDRAEPADRSSSRAPDLVIVCNLPAWRRGHTHDGDRCHVVGGGPIPVAVARELARDAFLKAVLHDGVNIHTVAHFGRHIPAHLRTALDLGPLPDLDGVTCLAEHCDRRYHLEWDHDDPVANGGATSFENMKPRCKADHWEKTERDRKAGRLGGGRADPNEPP